MAPLIDLINERLDDRALSQLSQQIGADPNTTRQAVPAALTALLGGLSHNTAQPAGAQQLAGALARDHDGGLLDDLSGFLGNPANSQGAGILGHVFGARRPAVESQVSRTTGLDQAQVARLLMLLAPVVLGALGRAQRQRGLDPGGLSDVLGHERQRIEQAHPQHRGLLNVLLDRDQDGQIADDLMGMAGDFMRGRR
ncbi:MAG TPA: DUF937 domain-containing protein [Thermoanaerobaculia bacterium]